MLHGRLSYCKKINSLLSLSKEDIVFKSIYGCLFTQVFELVNFNIELFLVSSGIMNQLAIHLF